MKKLEIIIRPGMFDKVKDELSKLGIHGMNYSDILGTDEDVIYRGIENEVERKLLMNAVSKLSKREKTIVRLRFGLGTVDGQEMTQKEVANLLGISQSYISRLEKKIMRQLKKEISLHI